MRYVMREQLFSLGNDYVIRDEAGHEAFHVDGKAFSLGKQLSFQGPDRRELVLVRQRLLAWGPTFEVLSGGDVVALIRKDRFTFFRCRFTVDVAGPDDLEAEGEFLHHEYRFSRRGRTVARVTKEWPRIADTYGVEIAESESDILILAATVVIDLACHSD